MDELIQHFKNLEKDETLKRIDDSYNRGWNDAMNNPEVKKALERMKPMKVLNKHFAYDSRADLFIEASCPSCGDDVFDCAAFCDCGQRLDWSE